MAIYLGSERIRIPIVKDEETSSEIMESIISGTIESYYNDRVSYIGNFVFTSQSNLISVNFSNCTHIGSEAFRYCSNLTSINFPNCSYIGSSVFNACFSLVTAIFPNCTYIGTSAFKGCYNLISLNLIGISSVPALSNVNAFSSTPIGGYSTSAGQYGSVYVPASLYDSFLTATNWSLISSRIVSV